MLYVHIGAEFGNDDSIIEQRARVPSTRAVRDGVAIFQGARPQRTVVTVGHDHRQRGRPLGHHGPGDMESTGKTVHATGGLRRQYSVL